MAKIVIFQYPVMVGVFLDPLYLLLVLLPDLHIPFLPDLNVVLLPDLLIMFPPDLLRVFTPLVGLERGRIGPGFNSAGIHNVG